MGCLSYAIFVNIWLDDLLSLAQKITRD